MISSKPIPPSSVCTLTPGKSMLIFNIGSSSIKFAVYESGSLLLKSRGKIEVDRNGNKTLTIYRSDGASNSQGYNFGSTDKRSLSTLLFEWIEQQYFFHIISCVGHRITHGRLHTQTQLVSESLLSQLRQESQPYSTHLPNQIEMIDGISARMPSLDQYVCFDSHFHNSLPRIAQLLTIPRSLSEKGLLRYGFHGISCAYIIQELEKFGDHTHKGRVIILHLGSGVSITALLDGSSLDTSMGFSPTSGVPMATRSGDLDPNVIFHLLHHEKMSINQVQHLVNVESGLIGISQTTSDMRGLLDMEEHDSRASEAIALFCYQIKKSIGSYAAVLGGIDTLVFTGGIGEHQPFVRSNICDGLGFLGITLDKIHNANNAQIISTENTPRVKVRVIHTNEEYIIAKSIDSILPTENTIASNEDWATYE